MRSKVSPRTTGTHLIKKDAHHVDQRFLRESSRVAIACSRETPKESAPANSSSVSSSLQSVKKHFDRDPRAGEYWGRR